MNFSVTDRAKIVIEFLKLVSPDGVAPSRMVGVPASVNQVYLTERPPCLQHVHRNAARHAGLSAAADPCYRFWYFLY